MTGPRDATGRPSPTFTVKSPRRGETTFPTLDEAIASARRALLTETLCGNPAEVTISTLGRTT